MLLTRSPLYSRPFRRTASFAFDLHVLGTPPAFILSQDQTLRRVFVALTSPPAGGKVDVVLCGVSRRFFLRGVAHSAFTSYGPVISAIVKVPGRPPPVDRLEVLLRKNFTVVHQKGVLRSGECEALAPGISPIIQLAG